MLTRPKKARLGEDPVPKLPQKELVDNLNSASQPIENSGSQIHTLVTISDDQSILEKVQERRLLALRDRTTGIDHSILLPFNASTGTHPLQIYQMQLMLLEKQNKKRLLMARQEGNTVSEENMSFKNQRPTTVPLNMQKNNIGRLNNVAPKANITMSAPVNVGESNYTEKRPLAGTDDPTSSSSDVSKMDVLELEHYIKRLQAKAKLLEAETAHVPTSRQQILYRISDHEEKTNEKLPLYFDAPEYVVGQKKRRLRYEVPVENFDLYLEQNKDISFIVISRFQ